MNVTAAMRLVRATARELLADCSDAELLHRFVADKDEAAFREILEKLSHGAPLCLRTVQAKESLARMAGR